MPNELKFTLRQYTPIIHFQSDQPGATLRATEVKPKLDRFLIERKGGWENIPNTWKVGGKDGMHQALNYSSRRQVLCIVKELKITS